MKVLFAVNNDNISNAIVKKYQKDFREIISYKNVYYFNAILKEIQNDKTYDRIVISEDLEPFANNNYDTIDKFIFEKLDKISDEATKANGDDIDIILICTDRRNIGDDMLNKFFGIGIYNALVGDERSIDNLCNLMNQPRNKKEAKRAYKIDGSTVGYQAEDENNVSEAEVQNILAHYKRLGKDEDRYVDSFNNIVAQYTDAQLRIIIRYLPLNVKAVLEERSPKYQELSTFSSNVDRKSGNGKYVPKTAKNAKQEEKIKVKMLNDEKDKIEKPILIPSALKKKENVKIEKQEIPEPVQEPVLFENIEDEEQSEEQNQEQDMVKRGRGRPRKNSTPEEMIENKPKRGRGRPRKIVEEEETNNEGINLFDLDESDDNEEKDEFEEIDLFNLSDEKQNKIENEKEEENDDVDDIDLFNIGSETDEPGNKQEEADVDLFNMDDDEIPAEYSDLDLFNLDDNGTSDDSFKQDRNEIKENRNLEPAVKVQTDINTILTGRKKMVSFVGTTKNGTSFIVNNVALMLASLNISTAILDMTSSKNAYYIYTNDDDRLRTVADQCIYNLEKGIDRGIEVDKNLTIYTEMPGETREHKNIDSIISTILEKHDVLLIDTDFNTDYEYFEKSQEIYLVQNMDVLTIQPLTAFLRNLKSKGILRQEKIKIVINMWQRVGKLTEKVLIGGMSSYNDPAMSYMTELFNKDNVQYCKIPFELQNNVKYLESLVDCKMNLRGYTKQLLAALDELSSMVYPRLSQPNYSPLKGRKMNHKMEFSERTNSTLNKMKNNY